MSSGRPRVAIIGTYSFPYGEAASNRVLALAKAIGEAGFEPLVIGRGLPRECDRIGDGRYCVEGVEYWSYGVMQAKTFQQRMNRPVKAVQLLHGERGIDHLMIYACASYMFIPSLLSFCRGAGIPVSADVVEWYLPTNFKHGRLNYAYYVFSYVFRQHITKIPRLIVTSSLLEEYFAPHGAKILRVPAIVDVSQMRENKLQSTGKRRIVYAGIPGRKDLLSVSIRALSLLSDEELAGIEFDILGPTQADITALVGQPIPGRIAPALKIRGRVPVDEVSELLAQSDFTVLIREKNRVTQAGFSSKVPEAMGHGVVPILTDTSGLRDYLTDGVDCFFLRDCSEQACAEALRKALALSDEQLNAMKQRARDSAQASFDYHQYVAPLQDFLTGGVKR